MDRVCVLLALSVAAFAAAADVSRAPQTDRERWNAGIGSYLAGDVTNALERLRPLMASDDYRVRAAKVVTKIEYDSGNREAAADAAQIALRAKPDDAQADRNFTLATDGLPQLREDNHVKQVQESDKGDPGSQLQQATCEARALMAGYAAIATNPPARAVAAADDLAGRARKLSDVWLLPSVQQAAVQGATNEEQSAAIVEKIGEAWRKTREAAMAFEDMDANRAYSALAYAEQDLTRFLKTAVMPPAAMEEDEKAQSNAWLGVEAFNDRGWQKDALDYTDAFVKKFPQWARDYEQQAQSDTNKPPFTAEDQEKVMGLAKELRELQLGCDESGRQKRQAEALEKIRKIRELLPKDKNGGGQDQQNQNQDQQQNNDQQNQGQDKQPQDQQGQDRQDQNDQPQDQDQQQENEGEAQEGDEKPENSDVEAILKRVQERNDEHEAEKRARMRKPRLPPNVRDL